MWVRPKISFFCFLSTIPYFAEIRSPERLKAIFDDFVIVRHFDIFHLKERFTLKERKVSVQTKTVSRNCSFLGNFWNFKSDYVVLESMNFVETKFPKYPEALNFFPVFTCIERVFFHDFGSFLNHDMTWLTHFLIVHWQIWDTFLLKKNTNLVSVSKTMLFSEFFQDSNELALLMEV